MFNSEPLTVVQLLMYNDDANHNFVFERKQIPQANSYVICHDPFMSNWGPCAGRENWMIFLCESTAEAKRVAKNIKERGDWEKVQIVTGHKPYIKTWRESGEFPVYQIKDRNSMPNQYRREE